jgi:hypothetical protein
MFFILGLISSLNDESLTQVNVRHVLSQVVGAPPWATWDINRCSGNGSSQKLVISI